MSRKIFEKKEKVKIEVMDQEVQTEMHREEIDQLISEHTALTFYEGEWTELLRTAEREGAAYARQAETLEQELSSVTMRLNYVLQEEAG